MRPAASLNTMLLAGAIEKMPRAFDALGIFVQIPESSVFLKKPNHKALALWSDWWR